MAKFKYPNARQTETVETYHAKHKIDNKFDWMEDPDGAETVKFCEDQNVITNEYLAKYGKRDELKSGFEEANNYAKYGVPFRSSEHTDHYYFWHNSGLQNQYVMYQSKVAIADVKDCTEFLNPNAMSEDGTLSVGSTKFSPDGQLMAYTLSQSGSDWQKVHFRKTMSDSEPASFAELEDVLCDVKYSCLVWSKDSAGVFYCGYPGQAGKTDGTETTKAESQKLFYHRLGEDQAKDQLIAEYPEESEWMIGAAVSTCGKYLFKDITRGCERTCQLYFAKLNDDKSIPRELKWRTISDNFDALYEYSFNVGSKCFIETNLDAPKKRIITIDLESEDLKIEEYVAEHEKDVLQGVYVVNDKIFLLEYLRDCKEVMRKCDIATGKDLGFVEFPDMGSLVTSARKYTSEVFFKLIGWVNPGAVYRWDCETDEMKLVRQTVVAGFDASQFQTAQVFYESKDGTKVPMFLVHKRGMTLDGTNPTILYGYGGFNISLTPSFSPYRPTWCSKLNGVLAIANIRGGGEYGKEWHDAGKVLKKQNCYDDFQAAGEWLIDNKYTSPSKLAIQGGSNGGTLVGVCFNQRPDLFKAVLCHCPVIDMLRFQRYTIGHAWQSDFGRPDDSEEEFLYNLKYSPLHNVKKSDTPAPGMMIFTADHDDRVSPHHALKFAAEVQNVHGETAENPLMIRIEMKAGHGAGKPMHKVIDEQVDIYSFLALQLGLE